MKIYIAGIGMDGQKTLTSEALSKIKNADVLIGAERMIEPFSQLGKRTYASWRSEKIADFLQENSFENAVVLMSGDCGFYSGAAKLISALKDYEPEVICGIPSPVYFCSKIGVEWNDMRLSLIHI